MVKTHVCVTQQLLFPIQYTAVQSNTLKMSSTGFLHNEVKVSTLWRGLPNVVTSAISLPNVRKPDGYDYYAFSKGKLLSLKHE